MPNRSDVNNKMEYVENIEPGTIVAFRRSNGTVLSAKVVNRSTRYRRLKLETVYGHRYVVGYDSIVWVKTGKRWPRGVYEALKGVKREE